MDRAACRKRSSARLNAALVAIVKMPDTRERFAALNLEPVGSSPEQFAQFLKDDLEKYAAYRKSRRDQA
jgi:tripartite-type tricarboxylate transporter receptor subunit TctC